MPGSFVVAPRVSDLRGAEEGRTRPAGVLRPPLACYFAGLMSGSEGTMFVAFNVTSVVSGLNAYPALTR